MQWVNYFRNVVQRYLVAIEGWPDFVTFANLSTVSSSLPHLEMLRRKWELGTTYWKKLTSEEFKELSSKRDQQLEDGEIIEHTRRTRSDKGTKRKRVSDSGNNNGAQPAKKGTNHKSASVVPSDSEDSNVPDNDGGGSAAVNDDQSVPVDPPINAAAMAAIIDRISSDGIPAGFDITTALGTDLGTTIHSV